jgi:triphosphoribosyl-dephospho-CoA synthase
MPTPLEPAHGPEPAASALGALAARALRVELALTPKPGLVDRANAGSHPDMDLALFQRSIAVLAPRFPDFVRQGRASRRQEPEPALHQLRTLGRACESAMFLATGGVNTHKGGIFALGLLLAAAGRSGSTAPDRLCREVSRLCAGLVTAELAGQDRPRTAGELAYAQLGMAGARGEAASGFATVRLHALPAFLAMRARGASRERALHAALLQLLAFNADTNLVRRGGPAGLALVQARARDLLDAGGVDRPDYREGLRRLDAELIDRNLSPGGSADLLAVTWMLAQLPLAAAARRRRESWTGQAGAA